MSLLARLHQDEPQFPFSQLQQNARLIVSRVFTTGISSRGSNAKSMGSRESLDLTVVSHVFYLDPFRGALLPRFIFMERRVDRL